MGLNSLITHNFAPVITIGATWLIGGGIEFAGISCGLAAFGAVIGISCFNDNHKKKQVEPYLLPQNNVGVGFIDPEDPENKKRRRDEARATHQPLNNAEAREKASELGYREGSNPPFHSHGRPAFQRGNR